MCGIAGVLYCQARRPPDALLWRMAGALEHRGPDGGGARAFDHEGLAHRRLAIIDLSADAAQPMASPDGRAWVAFNGEIYNFRELRRALEQRGEVFRTSSDTEVIVR